MSPRHHLPPADDMPGTRVLYLANSSQIGGGNRSLLTMWSALRTRGITPIAVCPSDGPMVDACRGAGIECHVLPYHQPGWTTPRTSIAAHRQWSRLLRKMDVALIHANDPSGARSVSVAAWSHRLPVVCHVRFPPAPGYITWAFRFAPPPHVFIFNSQATLAEGAEEFQRACPSSRRTVIHNAVSLADFAPTSGGGIATRRRPKVGIVANLLPVKGHGDFLEMARRLADSGISADYRIIGEDIHRIGYRERLEARTRELGIADCVTFLGHRSDVGRLVADLDVVVCSSHAEPFGVCLIEAMACGRPVVATRVGGIPEVIEDGVCGFIVPAHAPAELAAAVGELLRKPSLRRSMGLAGRERVRQKFSPEALAARVTDVYRQLLPPAGASMYRNIGGSAAPGTAIRPASVGSGRPRLVSRR